MITEKVSQLIIASVQHGTDQQKATLQAFAVDVLNLAKAADDYADQSEMNDGDDEKENKVAESLVDLAGNLVDLSSADKIDQLKQLISDVYEDPDEELEAAGEALFRAAVDFRLSASMLADLFQAE